MGKRGAVRINFLTETSHHHNHHHPSSLHKTTVCINLFHVFKRFLIHDTQGTVTNTGYYAAFPLPVPQIRFELSGNEFTQAHIFALIYPSLPCVSLSERIANKIVNQANQNVELLQLYVLLTQELFVAVPVSEAETQKEEEEESTCAICLESLWSDEKLNLLHCPHRFHLECISEWLLKCNSCPLCRESIYKLQR